MRCLGVLTALLFFGVAASAAGDAALLPANGFAPGWTQDGQAKIYEGEALYDHIDGGGEAFLELGFEACTVQRYRKAPNQFTFELYRMKDTAAALGVYLTNCGRETPDEAFAERHTVGRNQLLAQKGRYYLVATSPEAPPGMRQVLLAAAKAVAERLPPAEPPAILALLPKEGLIPHSERIVRGPIGLQSLVTLGEGDVLLLDRQATAVAGDYRKKEGEPLTLIVAEYGSSQESSAALRNLTAKLDSTLSVLFAGDRVLAFKDSKSLFGEATLQGARLTIQLGLETPPSQPPQQGSAR
jgi:hypothetical protein